MSRKLGTIWLLETNGGDWLFNRNPNEQLPPYHVGLPENILHGHTPIHEYSKSALEQTKAQTKWNAWCRKTKGMKCYLVHPRHVAIETHNITGTRHENQVP